ncbi:multicopper oxidase domain-containing protein [Halosolutus halophilus]|uniref:multicopper oxidase domain-containing protein n=1 Tax=Halosolutus halophilus TaxID=1552990 RepID=UPI0022351965|nr:multicopper oxidase domain-containing protein [Halosolutus halophilus]
MVDNENNQGGKGLQSKRRTFIQGLGMVPMSGFLTNDVSATQAGDVSTESDGTVRTYTVHAIEVDIVYNRFDLHQPNGAMYVLEENLEEAREASGKTPDDGFAMIDEGGSSSSAAGAIEPLVIRANRGDTVEIEFHNHLDEPASMHQTGLPYDVQTSDGMSVGYNADTTAAPGETITYTWEAANIGTHFFYDGANQALDSGPGSIDQVNLLSRGLFGAIVVEPPGATWTDPETGEELRSGVRADIHDPNALETSYREFVVFYHSPSGLKHDVYWPHSDKTQHPHAINYRSDPSGQRVNDSCPDCNTEKTFYHSWTHGDPGGGDNIYDVYKGDPVKFCFVGASQEENHVHHIHNSRWKQVPRTDADTIDAQTIGLGDAFQSYFVAGHGPGSVRPDMTFEEAFENGGGGYMHEGAGDVLFHCHMFPHYAEGMWGSMRVHDKERDFLEPLPNSSELISAGSDTPGYPEFIGDAIEKVNGVDDPKGYIAPEPPLQSVDDPRQPTGAERKALGDDIEPGAPYAGPVPDGETPNRVIEYTIVAMPAQVAYNDAGEHDPDGIVYVLEEANVPGVTDGTVTVNNAEQVRNGELNPEPLFLRANVGDLIKVRLKNEVDGAGASIHPHFVGFDVLGSDSLANGYNYYQGTDHGETNEYRWYADERGTIYFHDHIIALKEGQHGMFNALLVEPEGSEWVDPYSGEPAFSGAQANIITPDDSDENDFREQALFLHDFVPLRNRDGELITQNTQHNVNAGTMAVNLRNAPYYNRDGEDPAYVHSSKAHGDPPTPVLEAYEGDPIKFRVLQGAYEEMHNFAIHGLRMDPEGFAPDDYVSHVIGPSEAFTFDVAPEATQNAFDKTTNPDGVPVRDYRYGSNVIDDLWSGLWGLVRIWGGSVNHLECLPDHGSPALAITDDQLAEMGHPSQFSDFDWTEEGQWAKHYYHPDDTDRKTPPDKNARQNPNVGETPPQAPGDVESLTSRLDLPEGKVREFDVTAIETEIPYNDYGDHDPKGVVFVHDRYADEVRNGDRDPQPLTLHANEDELVRVNLTNDLPWDLNNDDEHPLTRVHKDHSWKRSHRISLHPNQVRYDTNTSDGSAVGFNYDTTVGRDETVTYEWYADGDLGTVLLTDAADVRSNRHHGAFGQLIVKEEGAIALDAVTAEPTPDAFTNIVRTRGDEEDYRQTSLLFADGQFILNRHNPDQPIVPAGEEDDPNDPPNQLGEEPQDHGFGAVNYRSEPFRYRFEGDEAQNKVFSSDVHGDPNTPILEAFADDPTRFRIGCVADKGRTVTFHLAGHQWQRYQGVDESPITGVDADLSPGKSETFDLLGGTSDHPGDYLYADAKQYRKLESGMWGMVRVTDGNDNDAADPQPLPDRSDDVPLRDRPGYAVVEGYVTANAELDTVVGVSASAIGAVGAGGVYLFTDTTADQVTDLSNADVQLLNQYVHEGAGADISLVNESTLAVSDLVVHTETDINIVLEGTVLADLLEQEPDSKLAAFVRSTTNSRANRIAPLSGIGNRTTKTLEKIVDDLGGNLL